MSDQLEPELERVARMLAEAGPLPDAPRRCASARSRCPTAARWPTADLAAAAARRRRRRRAPAACRDRGRRRGDRGRAHGCSSCATTARRPEHRARGARVRAARAEARAQVVARGDGSATISLNVWKMPKPGAGTTSTRPGSAARATAASLGTFRIDATARRRSAYKVPRGELGGYRWIWVTNEPAGGSETPSERTALWGPLT